MNLKKQPTNIFTKSWSTPDESLLCTYYLIILLSYYLIILLSYHLIILLSIILLSYFDPPQMRVCCATVCGTASLVGTRRLAVPGRVEASRLTFPRRRTLSSSSSSSPSWSECAPEWSTTSFANSLKTRRTFLPAERRLGLANSKPNLYF